MTSCILEIISQTSSHYTDPVSYDFTNNFENMPLLVALLMHIVTTGGGGDSHTCTHGIVGCLATSVAKVSER